MSFDLELIRWASELEEDSVTALPNRLPIPDEVKNSGLKRNQPEPYQWYNEIHYQQYKAIASLQGTIDDYPFKTPLDYGAVGDGITDDTLAIQDWLDNESIYYLGDNDFYFTDTLTVDSNNGAHWFPSKGKLYAEVYNKTVMEFLNSDDLIIDGLNLDMTRILTENQLVQFRNGLLFSNCKRGIMQKSKIIGAPSQAVNIRDRSTGFKVHSNYIEEAGRLQQINAGTGISIGGGILVFNSSSVDIVSNYIKRSWSAGIYVYADTQEGGLPVDYETVDGFHIQNNWIYESQSNGIRTQGDDYPESVLSKNNIINGNVVFNTGRTCIRGNGIGLNVCNNIVGFDLNPIYGSTSDLPNNGIATNHCLDSIFDNNVIFNCAAGIEFTTNSLSDYGIERSSFSGNIIKGCVYGVYRSGELTTAVRELNIQSNHIDQGQSIQIVGGDTYDAREHINLRNVSDITIKDNTLKGRSAVFEFSASITILSSDNIIIDTNTTKGASSSLSVSDCTDIIVDGNRFKDNVYSCIALVDSSAITVSNNFMTFNTSDEVNTVGIGCDNITDIDFHRNKIKSDSLIPTSAILLSNTSTADLTEGVINNNIFETTNGINNQIVNGEADGRNLAQYNNLHSGVLDNVRVDRILNKTDGFTAKPDDCGTKNVIDSGTIKAVTLPEGLPIGWKINFTNIGDNFARVNLTGGDYFLDNVSQQVDGTSITVEKKSATRWLYILESENITVSDIVGGSASQTVGKYTVTRTGVGTYQITPEPAYTIPTPTTTNGFLRSTGNSILVYDTSEVASDMDFKLLIYDI